MIAVAFDHKGMRIREEVLKKLKKINLEHIDLSHQGDDYPELAVVVGKAINTHKARYGILVDSTGMGMCLAANKISGIRATICRSSSDAADARQKFDANVLCLASDLDGIGHIIKEFFAIDVPPAGNHQIRLQKFLKLLDPKAAK